MEIRIRECAHGGYSVEKGMPVKEQPNPFGIGFIMGGFFVYESRHAETMKEAEKIAERMSK